jgi:hypothetical protein
MNTLNKIATITNLVAEIGDCDEIQFSLDGFIKVLKDLKTAKNFYPCDKCKVKCAGAWSISTEGKDWEFCDICMGEHDKLADKQSFTITEWVEGKIVVLTEKQLEGELGEAYREGYKTALELVPAENRLTPPEKD